MCRNCNHKEHKPGQCEQCNCGESEVLRPVRLRPEDLEIDPRSEAVNKGHRVKRKKTSND